MLDYVSDSSAFSRLLSKLEKSRWIALDTEFVSERRFQPQLCLVQIAHEFGVSLLDPILYRNSFPFWELLAEGDHETIVHAGRGDLEFCIRETGTLPKRLFDTQLAAGFVGLEYPAGCANLIARVLNINLPNTETRTDWSRRPLNQNQLEYGLDDVRYLQPMRELIGGKLEKLNRTSWFEEDMNAWKEKTLWQFGPNRWEKLVLNSAMERQSLAIVRELYFWREQRAEMADCPARRILRDDLIMELAKRKTYNISKIREIRDFNQSSFTPIIEPIADAVYRAMHLPIKDCPPLMDHDPNCKMAVLGQLLYSALGTICKQNSLACNLVANPSDVRQWALWRLRPDLNLHTPLIEQGWRKSIVGEIFEELLSGKMVIRVAEPASDEPLEFLRKV